MYAVTSQGKSRRSSPVLVCDPCVGREVRLMRFGALRMDHLPTLVAEARQAIDAASDMAALDDVRVRYLGKKGEITSLLKGLGKLPAEQRPAAGERINEVKQLLGGELDTRRQALRQAA